MRADRIRAIEGRPDRHEAFIFQWQDFLIGGFLIGARPVFFGGLGRLQSLMSFAAGFFGSSASGGRTTS